MLKVRDKKTGKIYTGNEDITISSEDRKIVWNILFKKRIKNVAKITF